MFGQLNLEKFEGLTEMPQKAASAWSGAIEERTILGATYKPLLYLGEQPVNGVLYWFIAEQTIIYKDEIRHVVKLALLEKYGEYELARDSVIRII